MKRLSTIGGIALVMCMFCVWFAVIIYPSPIASGMFFLAGAFYGMVMSIAMNYAHQGKAKDEESD
jgi:hypothetical protein